MTVSIATEDSKPNLGLRQYQSFFISFVSLLLIAGATLYLLPNQLGKTKILRIPKFFKERSKANLHRLKEAIRGNVSDSVKGDSSVWVPCTLRQRRELVTGMSRYTFDLPSPRSTLDLELGQRVIFEVEHEPGKVSRGSYLLCTERTQQGNFDVVVPSTAASAVSGLDLSGNNDPGFSDALSHLNIGDLVRVRPGAKMLYYRGPKSPVDTLSIACSGVGVAPICSLLVDILSDPESAVTSVVLLVVNDQADQFICLDELESLEKRFSHIVKTPTDSSTWEQTNFIEEAVSNYCPFWKEGMMALLCGSSNFIGHGLKSFRLLGYSKEANEKIRIKNAFIQKVLKFGAIFSQGIDMDWEVLTQSQPGRLPIRRNSGCWNSSDGWIAYFPEEADAQFSLSEDYQSKVESRQTIVDTFYNFFETRGFELLQKAVEEKKTANCLSSLFFNYCYFKKQCQMPEFEAAFYDMPDEVVPCMSLAAIRVLEDIAERLKANEAQIEDGSGFSSSFVAALKTLPPVSPGSKLWIRFYNLEQSTALKDLKAAYVGKMISSVGTVIRVSNIRQQVVGMPFICCRCGKEVMKYFPDYKYCIPQICTSEFCKSKTFSPVRNRAQTIDWQRIRIQEAGSDSTSKEAGRMPRMVDVELTGDLIDSCHPGDIVSICGIVKVLPVSGEGSGKNSQIQKSLHHLYIDANSVIKGSKGVSMAEDIRLLKPLKFRKEEIFLFKKTAEDPGAFTIIVKSLCPSIYGHDIIKAGLTLVLFGGCSKKDKIWFEAQSIRSDLHCLLVGDPGLGKSQMLKAICDLSPRGVYVSGNSSSAAGLTVTVVKEQGSGDYALEAGAMVLGDQGICCVDEFDKMRSEHHALLETMEQQRVSVAKAGILCSLSARTSVIAAANPRNGHYDDSKTVSENLRISPQLLSRFDIIFLMLDRPHEGKDRQLAEYVTSMHLKQAQATSEGRKSFGEAGSQLSTGGTQLLSLPLRLEKQISKSKLLSQDFFRRYISYAKATVKTKLNANAKKVLKDFYLKLRSETQGDSSDSIPVTTRLLESLIRLTEARARSELREEATEFDAQDVVDIMQFSVINTVRRPTGNTKIRDGKTSLFKKFLRLLQAESSRTSKAHFSNEELKEMGMRLLLSQEQIKELVDRLNYEGFLIRKRDHWKLMTCGL
eukprot:jgi/Galph1/3127/GphlegSOOS_G1815.1